MSTSQFYAATVCNVCTVPLRIIGGYAYSAPVNNQLTTGSLYNVAELPPSSCWKTDPLLLGGGDMQPMQEAMHWVAYKKLDGNSGNSLMYIEYTTEADGTISAKVDCADNQSIPTPTTPTDGQQNNGVSQPNGDAVETESSSDPTKAPDAAGNGGDGKPPAL